MMAGAGFMRQMIDSYKQNRSLLKGSREATYQNFDKSYITDSIISRKPLVFKKSSPEYLEELKVELKLKRKRKLVLKMKVLIISTLVTGLLFYLVFV